MSSTETQAVGATRTEPDSATAAGPDSATAAEPGAEPGDASRLYLALGRITRTLRKEAAASPVGHGALSALATLSQYGAMRPGELAAREGVSPPSMTRTLASLERLEVCRRTPDPTDSRAQLVEATAAGRQLLDAGRSARMTVLRRRLQDLPPQQQQLLLAAIPALEALAAGDG